MQLEACHHPSSEPSDSTDDHTGSPALMIRNVLPVPCTGVFKTFLTLMLLLPGLQSTTCAQDKIEFQSGATIEGTVKQINSDSKQVEFETTIAGRKFLRTYDFSKIRSVTVNGQKKKLSAETSVDSLGMVTRTKPEVLARIDAVGATLPDWYEATDLNYPSSLDLSWPLKPPTKGWNNQKNVGQFIWDVVNPNPGRWKPGIKLVHHCLSLHKGDSALTQRDMKTLGTMYFNLLQDYEHAAWWYQQAKVPATDGNGIRLAECYWRLGNRDMALDMLRGKALPISAIKLLGAMGEIDGALQVAAAYANSTQDYQANLLAADALRQAGRTTDALTWYQKVLDSKNFRNADYEQRLKARATESIQAINIAETARIDHVADGTYQADSIGYNGALRVEVRVADKKLQTVTVTSHREKQFYAALTDTPSQIVARQSVENIDATTGATITSQAIVNATAKALASGSK